MLKLLLRVYLLPVLLCLPVRCFLLFHWYYRYIQTPWQMNPPLPPHHLLPKPNRIFPVGENMSDMDSVLLCATQLHERETPDNFQRIRSVWTLISRVKTTTDWVWKVFSFSVRKKKLEFWISGSAPLTEILDVPDRWKQILCSIILASDRTVPSSF